MKATMLLAIFLFAETWSGYLVDARCYASQERNVNPFDGNFNTNHNRGYEIRVCRPSTKTKSFVVVNSDGSSFELAPSGNAKAAALIQRAPKEPDIAVTVTGEKHKEGVTADSITLAR